MTSSYLKISDDLTIHYETTGEGDIPVVFIPGWTTTTKVFERQLSHLDGSDRFEAVAYDPRAQGLSSKTADGHHYEQRGRDLHRFFDRLGLADVVLVAWSNGGLDALSYVNQFGAGRLQGLVLVDATPKTRGADLTKEWVWFGTKEEGDQDGLFRQACYDVLIDRQSVNVAVAEWVLEDPSAENVAFFVDQANHTSDTVASLLSSSSWFLDYSEDLKALDGEIPLLYVVRDEWSALATSWAEANTPAAEVVAFGKHMMLWERPDQFNEVLDTFLARVQR